MKSKTIIATVMALVLTTCTFGTTMTSAAASEKSTVNSEQSYSISVGSTGQSTVTVYNNHLGIISSAKAMDTILIQAIANDGYKVAEIIADFDNGTHCSSGDYSLDDNLHLSFVFRMEPGNMTITVITIPLASPAPTPDPIPTPTWKKGDVNLDGYVNAADATLVLRHVAGLEKLTGQKLINADVNGDGYVNTSDATEILKIVAGIA